MDAEDDDIDYDYDIDYDVITTSTPEPGAKLKKPKLVAGPMMAKANETPREPRLAKPKKPKLVAESKPLNKKANNTPRPAAGVLSGDKSTNSSAVSNDRAKRDAKSKDSPSPTSSV